jgi:hypothetical protein
MEKVAITLRSSVDVEGGTPKTVCDVARIIEFMKMEVAWLICIITVIVAGAFESA